MAGSVPAKCPPTLDLPAVVAVGVVVHLGLVGVEFRARALEEGVVHRAAEVGDETADEAYELVVSPSGVRIVASSERGERWARVTLDQLARLAGGRIPCCRIVDWPALKWRGFMNDCGRNFLALEGVKAMIDLAGRYKMNLFHWHLADYHGWRLESKKYPMLQAPWAFRRQLMKFYTQKEFREILDYAAARGITVMPEFDVPGHSLAFRRAFGFRTMRDEGVRQKLCDLVDELCALAPAELMPFVHIGTDEVRSEAERVPDAWYALWAQRVTANGRIVMGWHPGHALETKGAVYQETWYETRSPTGPYVDGTCYYIDSFDPAGLLAQAAFKRPCPYPVDQSFRVGAEIQAWHDDPIARPADLVRDNPVFAAIVLFSDSYWADRPKNRTDLIFRPPPPDRPPRRLRSTCAAA